MVLVSRSINLVIDNKGRLEDAVTTVLSGEFPEYLSLCAQIGIPRGPRISVLQLSVLLKKVQRLNLSVPCSPVEMTTATREDFTAKAVVNRTVL